MYVINPRRASAVRVTVVALSVCVSVTPMGLLFIVKMLPHTQQATSCSNIYLYMHLHKNASPTQCLKETQQYHKGRVTNAHKTNAHIAATHLQQRSPSKPGNCSKYLELKRHH